MPSGFTGVELNSLHSYLARWLQTMGPRGLTWGRYTNSHTSELKRKGVVIESQPLRTGKPPLTWFSESKCLAKSTSKWALSRCRNQGAWWEPLTLCFFPLWPWANYSTSLYCNFTFCIMGEGECVVVIYRQFFFYSEACWKGLQPVRDHSAVKEATSEPHRDLKLLGTDFRGFCLGDAQTFPGCWSGLPGLFLVEKQTTSWDC